MLGARRQVCGECSSSLMHQGVREGESLAQVTQAGWNSFSVGSPTRATCAPHHFPCKSSYCRGDLGLGPPMMEIPTDPRIAGDLAAFPDSQVELWGGLSWLPLFGSPASLPEVRQEAGLVVSCWLEPSGYFQVPVEYCQCLGVTGLCVGHLAPQICLVRSFQLSAPRVHSLLS